MEWLPLSFDFRFRVETRIKQIGIGKFYFLQLGVFAFIFVVGFFAVWLHEAYGFSNQIYANATSSLYEAGFSDRSIAVQTLGIGDGSTITSIVIKGKPNNQFSQVGVCAFNTFLQSQKCGGSTTGEFGRITLNNPTTDANGYYTFTIDDGTKFGAYIGSSTIITSASYYYSFFISEAGSSEYINGSNADTYVSGQAQYFDTGTLGTSSISIADLYFQFTDQPQAIWLDYPPDESSIAGDFSHWRYSYTNATTSPVRVKIEYGSSTTFTDYDVWNFFAGNVSNRPFGKTHVLQGSNLTAQAFLLDQQGNELAESQIYNFSITGTYTNDTSGNTYGSSTPIGFSTSTDNIASFFYIDCSAYAGVGLFSSGTIDAWGCAIKKTSFSILQFILVPHDLVTGFVLNSFQGWKEVFPFKFFFELKETLEAQIELNNIGMGQTLDLYLRNPDNTTSTPYFTLTDDTLKDYLGTNARDLWYNAVMMFASFSVMIAIVIIIF